MRVVAVSVAAVFGLSLAGCADSATPDDSPTGALHEPVAQTVTATATHTATTTVTATITATETQTVTASADATTPPPTAARPNLPSSGYDVDWAHNCAERILEDIERLDEYVLDGIAVPSTLRMLAQSYECLEDEGAPPGVDAADYLSRLVTLQNFTLQAADSYFDDPVTATATYSAVRQQTAPLLHLLNEATGSAYELP